MLDNSREYDDLDREIWSLVKDKKHIILSNKSDLNNKMNTEFKNAELISTNNINDIERIKKLIFDFTIDSNIAENDIILVNSRHYVAINEALSTMEKIINMINNASLDCVSVEINYAWTTLGQIIGNTDIENIIDKIFSKFCLGK